MSKIILGTAQLGLKYGIANTKGKISDSEVFKILGFAFRKGIHELDTAKVYGDSEKIIGNSNLDFKVITKLPSYNINDSDVPSFVDININGSKKNLKQESLHAVLFHNSSQLLSKDGEKLYSVLNKKKEVGEVKNIGISVYEPKELLDILKYFHFDLIQIPNNVFDLRWDEILHSLDKKNIEVHARSIFLQGAVFVELDKRLRIFNRWKKLWLRFEEWIKDNNISPMIKNNFLSKIILGVDSVSQLSEITQSLEKSVYLDNVPEEIKTLDSEFLNPMNWTSQ